MKYKIYVKGQLEKEYDYEQQAMTYLLLNGYLWEGYGDFYRQYILVKDKNVKIYREA